MDWEMLGLMGFIGICAWFVAKQIEVHIARLPNLLDEKIREILVQYHDLTIADKNHRKWLDVIMSRRMEDVSRLMEGKSHSDSYEYLRREKAYIEAQIAKDETRYEFLRRDLNEVLKYKYDELIEIEMKIKEHPDRDRIEAEELEATKKELREEHGFDWPDSEV